MNTLTSLLSPRILTQAFAIVLLMAGLWRRDCVLLASAPVLAQRSFLLAMERGRPWCALRAAVRAITAGTLGLLAATAIAVHVLGVQLGWWWTAGGPDAWTPVWLLAAALPLVLLQRDRALLARESRFWLFILTGAWASSWPWSAPVIGAACAFALVAGLVMAWTSWGLAHHTGSGLLRQAD